MDIDYPQTRVTAQLEGKVALVSGARQGIGAAIGRAFIAEGARVAALLRRPDQAAEVEPWRVGLVR